MRDNGDSGDVEQANVVSSGGGREEWKGTRARRGEDDAGAGMDAGMDDGIHTRNRGGVNV